MMFYYLLFFAQEGAHPPPIPSPLLWPFSMPSTFGPGVDPGYFLRGVGGVGGWGGGGGRNKIDHCQYI